MLTPGGPLHHVTGISQADFRSKYMEPRRPCIVDGVDGLHPEWNLDFFRTNYGSKAVPLNASFLDTEPQLRMMKLFEYLDLLEVNEQYVRGVERLYEIIELAGGKENLYYPETAEGDSDVTAADDDSSDSAEIRASRATASDDPLALLRDEFWQLYEQCNELRTSLPPGKVPYVRNLHITAWFPKLADELATPPPFMKPNYLFDPPKDLIEKGLFPDDIQPGWQRWTELFIGGRGVGFPYLHYDTCLTHAWSAVLHGKKKFYLIDPQYTDRLYAGHRGTKEISKILGDIDQVDYEKFPLFKGVPVQTVVVEAGQLLYIPPGWWHTAKIENICITMAGNFVNDLNLEEFNNEYKTFCEQGRGTSVLTGEMVAKALNETKDEMQGSGPH